MQIGVPDYLRKTDWTLDEVSFSYLGGRYNGRGFLTWEPEVGFRLEAFVTRSGPPLPPKVTLGAVRLAKREDRTSIRMRIRHSGRAFTMATLADRFDILTDDRLSCALGVVRFMTPAPAATRTVKRWSGSALIDVGSSLIWPGQIIRTVDLEGVKISEAFEWKGVLYETPTLSVRGREDGGRLAIHWSMDKAAYRRADAWRWPMAFHQALSIELGCSLPLFERQVLVFPRQHLERFKAGKLIELHPYQPIESDLVDKARLFWLTDFFMKDTREARTARKLFDQMVRARQQTRWDDIELILSTALEGTLRTLDGVLSSDRQWKPHDSLARFQKTYLSPAWRPLRKRALAAFERLRHSTAHPDWVVDKTAEATRSQSFDDLRFLSRFYGYMILAMAGYPNLQPPSTSPAPASPPTAAAPQSSGSGEVM